MKSKMKELIFDIYNFLDDDLDEIDDDEDMEPCPKQAKINTTVSRICYWRKNSDQINIDQFCIKF